MANVLVIVALIIVMIGLLAVIIAMIVLLAEGRNRSAADSKQDGRCNVFF
jgi:hypothetical protein